MRKTLTLIALAAGVGLTTPAQSATIITTLPEFNGNGAIANTFIGTFNYVLPVGEEIASVNFRSSFGNSTINSTAVGVLTLDGITLASCARGDPCFSGGPVPINFDFSAADFSLFSDGLADLFYNQTDCCVIRLGESTLTITTRAVSGAIPEPSTWAMMLLGFGFVGGAMRTVKRRQRVTVSYA